jgi:hypothetical protein
MSDTQPDQPSAVEQLRAKLREAEAREAAEAKERADSVQPVVTVEIRPADREAYAWREIYDDAVTLWTVEATLQNEAELKAVGKEHRVGSMTYYFNTATGRLVTSVGGGYVYLKKSREQWDEVSAFIVAHAEGGDITELVTKYAHVKAW